MKILFILTILLLMVVSVSPAAAEVGDFNFGFEAGYVELSDSDFSEIYGSGGITFGVNAAYRLLKNASIRTGFNFYSAKGKTALSGQDLKVNLNTLRIGGYYHFNLKKIVPMIGGGLAMTFFKEKDPWGGSNKVKTGWFVGAGADIPVCKKLLAGLELLYKDIKIQGEFASQSIGGLALLLNLKVKM